MGEILSIRKMDHILTIPDNKDLCIEASQYARDAQAQL
jgi:hypothetical protein